MDIGDDLDLVLMGEAEEGDTMAMIVLGVLDLIPGLTPEQRAPIVKRIQDCQTHSKFDWAAIAALRKK